MADEALDPSGANDGPVLVNVDPFTNGKVKAVCHFLWFICVLMKYDRLLDSTCGGMPWESRRVPPYFKFLLGSHHDRNLTNDCSRYQAQAFFCTNISQICQILCGEFTRV